MKRTMGLLLVVVMCIGLFTGCGGECYVGKWTSTIIREEGDGDTDFAEETGYQEVHIFNANGTYERKWISVDPEKCSQEECDEWEQEYKEEHPNEKWKYVQTKNLQGVRIWDADNEEEPDDDDKPDWILEDNYLCNGNIGKYVCCER